MTEKPHASKHAVESVNDGPAGNGSVKKPWSAPEISQTDVLESIAAACTGTDGKTDLTCTVPAS